MSGTYKAHLHGPLLRTHWIFILFFFLRRKRQRRHEKEVSSTHLDSPLFCSSNSSLDADWAIFRIILGILVQFRSRIACQLFSLRHFLFSCVEASFLRRWNKKWDRKGKKIRKIGCGQKPMRCQMNHLSLSYLYTVQGECRKSQAKLEPTKDSHKGPCKKGLGKGELSV